MSNKLTSFKRTKPFIQKKKQDKLQKKLIAEMNEQLERRNQRIAQMSCVVIKPQGFCDNGKTKPKCGDCPNCLSQAEGIVVTDPNRKAELLALVEKRNKAILEAQHQGLIN